MSIQRNIHPVLRNYYYFFKLFDVGVHISYKFSPSFFPTSMAAACNSFTCWIKHGKAINYSTVANGDN